MKVYLIDDNAEEADLFAETLGRIDNTIELVWHDSVMHGLELLLNLFSRISSFWILTFRKFPGRNF